MERQERVLVNGMDWTAAGATAVQSTLIVDEGWRVVNAPRPIPGAIDWKGPFRHGTFYAAGPDLFEYLQGAPKLDLARRWAELDAWPCGLITNTEIRHMLDLKIAECGYDRSFESVCEDFGGVASLAGMYGLPWQA